MNSTLPPSRSWIERFSFLRSGWPWLLALLGTAMIWKWIALAATAPHGIGSLMRFTLVTLILGTGPGLFALRRFPELDSSRLGRVLWIVFISLGSNILVLWMLYMLGIYTVATAWTVVVISAWLGLLGSRVLRLGSVARAFNGWWSSQPILDRLVFAVLALDLTRVCLMATGMHFWAWDSIVSWDKWGCDMAERTGLGRYAMGGYPQMIPTLYSVYYKLAGSWLQGLPDEQLLLHGLNSAFAWLLLAGLIRLCALLRVRWSLAAVVLFGNQQFRSWLDVGYVDIPATALATGGFALLLGTALAAPAAPNRMRCATGWLLALPVFLMGFSKAQGLFYALLSCGAALWQAPAGNRRRTATAFGTGLLAGLALLAPFYAHQSYYSRHFSEADADPRCHTMTVEIAKPKLIDVSWSRALQQGKDLAKAYRQMPAMKHIDGSIYVVVFWGGLLVAVLVRRLRQIVVMAAAGYLLWFFTVSYDWRNAFVPMVLFSILLSGTMTSLAARWHQAVWFGRILILAVLLLFGTSWIWTVATVVPDWRLAVSAPPMWRTALEGRFNVASPGLRVVRVFLQDSPLGRQAHRIYCGDVFYRYLGAKGVYTLKGNSFTDVRNGDLLLQNGSEHLPKDFVPIARLRNLVYDTLAMVAPAGEPVQYAIQPDAGMTVTGDDIDGFFLAGPGAAELHLNLPFNVDGQAALLFRIDYEPADARLEFSLAPEWDAVTVLRTRMLFHSKKGVARGMVWLDKLPAGQTLATFWPIQLEKSVADGVCIRRITVELVPPVEPDAP